MFLIVARCTLDDIPMAILPTRERAEDYVRGVTGADIQAAAAATSFATSDVQGIDVIEFSDRSGLPTGESLPSIPAEDIPGIDDVTPL